MVEVGMRQDDRVDALRIDRERRPIAQAKPLEALEETAIDEHPDAVGLD